MTDQPPAPPPASPALVRALAAHPTQMAHLTAQLHVPVHDAGGLLDLLGRVAREAVRLFDDVTWAAVTAQFDGPPLTASHTDQRALIIDEHQYAKNDGPCLRAMRSNTTVSMSQSQLEVQWPPLAQLARRVGVGAILGVPVSANGRTAGALNLYSRSSVLPTQDPDLLTVLTEYTARGLSDFQNSDPHPSTQEVLRRAVAAAVAVEQAVHVLTQQHGFDPAYARQVLTDQAQDWGRTTNEQALHIINNATPD